MRQLSNPAQRPPNDLRRLFGVFLMIIMVGGLLGASLAVADSDTMVVTVFRLKHARASDVLNSVQPLLSDEGSITVQPGKNRLTVRDRADIVEEVGKAIERVDLAPQRFVLQVELLLGSNLQASVPPNTEVSARLKRMFPFKSYRSLGATEFRGKTGDDVTLELDDGYRIVVSARDHRVEETPFGIAARGLRLYLRPLVVEKQVGSRFRELLRTRVALSENQEVFIGAGASESGDQCLILIVTAHAGEKS